MVEKKYIFFDIDGTLTNANPGGIILPSTKSTLKKLEENGHFIAIATGRSYSMAQEAMEESGINNVVCCGGNGLVINGKVEYIKPLDKEKALMVIHECIEKDIPFGVMIDDSFNIYTHNLAVENKMAELKTFSTLHMMEEANYEKFEEIHKIHVYSKQGEENVLTSLEQSGLHYARYHNSSIIIEPDDKYKGILDMIHIIKGNEKDIVVFGDGHNDLSMVKQAPISIAMGNAIDELKEAATFITKGCNDDGIEYACKHFKWI